jgi:hypothetical protein
MGRCSRGAAAGGVRHGQGVSCEREGSKAWLLQDDRAKTGCTAMQSATGCGHSRKALTLCRWGTDRHSKPGPHAATTP